MGKLTVSDLRKLEKQVLQGEISYSKMVELINERTKQESDRKVMEFKERLILALPSHSKLDDEIKVDSYVKAKWNGYELCLNTIKELIEKLK